MYAVYYVHETTGPLQEGWYILWHHTRDDDLAVLAFTSPKNRVPIRTWHYGEVMHWVFRGICERTVTVALASDLMSELFHENLRNSTRFDAAHLQAV